MISEYITKASAGREWSYRSLINHINYLALDFLGVCRSDFFSAENARRLELGTLRQSLVRAQQNAQAQLQALVLHQRQLAAALRDLAEGAVPRAEHACRVAGRRGDDAVAAANTVRRELAEQQTQNDAQQRHVRQSIAALRLALDERPTQRQCADLASQTVARWVESDPGAEAWVRRAARSAVGAALGDGGALSAELEDRVARAARTAAAQAAERAAKEIVDKGDFLREAVEAVAAGSMAAAERVLALALALSACASTRLDLTWACAGTSFRARCSSGWRPTPA